MSLHDWTEISPRALNSTAITAYIFLHIDIASPQHLDRSLFAFVLTISNQKEFRIGTVAMFTSDLNAGVVPHMSPPPHDLGRPRTTMVDCMVLSIKISFHGSRRFIFTDSCSATHWLLLSYYILGGCPFHGPLSGMK